MARADLDKTSQRPQILLTPSTSSRKRKRTQEIQEARSSSLQTRDQSPSKRLRANPSSCSVEETSHPGEASDTDENSPDPLRYWVRTGKWLKEYFEQDSLVREDFERGKLPEESPQRDWEKEFQAKEPFRPMHGFEHLRHMFARRRSQSTTQTPSDQLPREVKSAQYKDAEYEDQLEVKGSYMRDSDLDVTEDSRKLCQNLLQFEQDVPQDSLFRHDMFRKTCQNIRNRNEAMVIRDIGLLIVPSAQTLATYSATHLNCLYESVNEGWNSAVTFLGTRPQPDYSVGFRRSAFTEEQLEKLVPFVGEIGSKLQSYFMTTTRMYFPFLTCEVKCGALDVADRQNAHSMTIAVRAIVELFRLVKREKELDREILAFSISHDDSSVRNYGHYPVIEGDKATFYRHTINKFDFTDLEGKEKWTAYKFTKNVYYYHSKKLNQMIRSAIDDLPANINFDLSESASLTQGTPQSLQTSHLDEVTPTTSSIQATEPSFKKPKDK